MDEVILNKRHPLYQEDLNRILSLKGIDSLKGRRILITGATGLIGVHLVDFLMRLGQVKVIVVGRNTNKAQTRLGEYFGHPDFEFIEQDVMILFANSLEADVIIPLASNTHPLAYSKFPVETILTNVRGAENALDLARRNGATVLYPSTVEIYGNSSDQDSFAEGDTGKLNLSTARSCYTESKRVSEAMCQSYLSEYGVVSKIVRLPRVFGPTMLVSDSKASSQFIKKAILGEDIVLKSKGDQFFSYIYVTDAVAALLYVLIHGQSGEAYNVSNVECNCRLKDFARLCAEYCGKSVVFELPSSVEAKGFSVAERAILDSSKLNELGFVARFGMREAIERTIVLLKQY